MGTFFRGSSSFCFIQHIISSGFSSVQCCFEFFPTTFQRSIEPLLACSHVHTRKRRPWHCVPNSFFSSCIHAVLLFEIILLIPLVGSVVVILDSCPHHTAQNVSSPCKRLGFALQFRSKLHHLVMCDSALSSFPHATYIIFATYSPALLSSEHIVSGSISS